jgi:hypothetical protein
MASSSAKGAAFTGRALSPSGIGICQVLKQKEEKNGIGQNSSCSTEAIVIKANSTQL